MTHAADPIEAALDAIDAEDGTAPRGALRRVLPALAAIVALSAFGAVVWYAYSTGVREGSEVAAPLLKPSGPSKIAPREPGGREILDQDKRVYGVIDRSAGDRRVERLLPPPENPLPPPVAAQPTVAPPLPTPKLAVPKLPPPPPSITAPATVPPPPTPVAKAPPIPKPVAKGPPVPKPAASVPPPPKPVASPAAKPDLKPASKPDVAAAPKSAVPPPPKPAPAVAKAVPAPKTAAPATAAPAAKTASRAPAKGYRVQIASLRSAEAARREWAKRVKQSGGTLAGLTLFIKRVDIPRKGIYFRVQAGPLLDKTAARRVCDTLKRRKIGCLVVKP